MLFRSETKVEGRKATPIPGSEHDLRAPLIISSIGSVPEPIPGANMVGEYFDFNDNMDLPQYKGNDRVFGVGNVVTGQGNIRVSQVHSQKVTEKLVEAYLGVGEGGDGARDISAGQAGAEARGAAQAGAVKEALKGIPGLSDAQIASLDAKIRSESTRLNSSH